MLGEKPEPAAIQCTDSDGRRQILHIQSAGKQLIAAKRDGGATLFFRVTEALQVVGAIARHASWVAGDNCGRRPLRVTINAAGRDGTRECAHIESTGAHVLLLREGGVFLHLDLRGAVKAVESITAHVRWLIAGRSS
ncbi:hypothetical protein [Alloactinosynnema sp. L-07]|uniref:hypothetical protein n=1 Tax=Alloactinosynnema sp. L-07 TaxID=1653480 RepID=UPI00065F0661|nr:hypothetical protein [Alloactinosynnema sp. L-07]CRK59104.1 hypothetical protein [Alloactinosynnema sp. L-07]